MIYADDAILVSASLTLDSGTVPEPGTATLVLMGLAATGLARRRRR